MTSEREKREEGVCCYLLSGSDLLAQQLVLVLLSKLSADLENVGQSQLNERRAKRDLKKDKKMSEVSPERRDRLFRT